MKVEPQEFESLSRWAETVLDLGMPDVLLEMPPEEHPMALLEAMALRTPARARQALAMLIGDLIEATTPLTPEEVASVDARLRQKGLPSLSDVRVRFMKQVRAVLARDSVRSEREYHAVRNAVEGMADEETAQRLWRLLERYEARIEGPRT